MLGRGSQRLRVARFRALSETAQIKRDYPMRGHQSVCYTDPTLQLTCIAMHEEDRRATPRLAIAKCRSTKGHICLGCVGKTKVWRCAGLRTGRGYAGPRRSANRG